MIPKFIYFLIIILLSQSAITAQIIKGQVIDYDTKEPIPFANIYFNNSFTGTTSDIDGYFSLDASSNPQQEIVISSIGYETFILQNYSADKYYEISLKEEVTVLKEFVVTSEGAITREEKIEFFKREFLGISKNAKSCVIENEKDLILEYSKFDESLVVSSQKPIIIRNKALGYRIHYQLEEFIFTKGNLTYRGYARFEQDSSSLKKPKPTIRQRKLAYKDSRMEFFRLLWNDEIKNSKKLEIYDTKDNTLIDISQFVRKENEAVKSLQFKGTLLIVKGNSFTHLSFVENTKTLFTKSGYFDPSGIYWNGAMSGKRIGDLLPYEYNSN